MTDFSRALAALKAGERIARVGWNGGDVYLCLAHGMPVELMVCRPHLDLLGEELMTRQIKYPKHIAMRTATKDVVPWLASSADIMANDWIILDRGVPL